MTHKDIWNAIDRLADSHGLSASGLAKKAGLDPTAFNKSKRVYPNGKLRWPGTESLARILKATGRHMGDFSTFLNHGESGVSRIPVIGFAQAGADGRFDDGGYPIGGSWDEIAFPDVQDPSAYALEISGDSMEPLYSDGCLVIVSPTSNVRRGDRVIVKIHDGQIMAKELARRTANKVELRSFNRDYSIMEFKNEDVVWMARILWVSQ